MDRPLTPEHRARLEDAAGKPTTAIIRTFRCTECDDGISAYTATQQLHDLPAHEKHGLLTWYKDLPDELVCRCQRTTVCLKYLRESMHYYLLVAAEKAATAQRTSGPASASAPADSRVTVSLAEDSTLVSADKLLNALAAFEGLLDRCPREEEVQAFLQESSNLLTLAFGARQMFLKPPILSSYRADFGYINARGELTLIEIERPSLSLFREDGGRSWEVTKALDQTLAWHNTITDHRRAVLHCIAGCPETITNIRYLVVAGRSSACDPDALTKLLRASDLAELWTYDHLIEHIRNALRWSKPQ